MNTRRIALHVYPYFRCYAFVRHRVRRDSGSATLASFDGIQVREGLEIPWRILPAKAQHLSSAIESGDTFCEHQRLANINHIPNINIFLTLSKYQYFSNVNSFHLSTFLGMHIM